MASANPIFKDHGSTNKPPLFSDEYFNFWKIRMKAHSEEQGEEVCDVVENGSLFLQVLSTFLGQQRLKAHGVNMIRKKTFTTRKQPTYFKVHLAWKNSSVSLNVQQKITYEIHW